MKIYFTYAGNEELAKIVADTLQSFGHEVLTKHLFSAEREKMLSRFWRYDRNMQLIRECDAVVAVLSAASNFETGFEVGHALAAGKAVYILYEEDSEKEMPVTVSGNSNPNLMKVPYENEEDLKQFLHDNFRVTAVTKIQ